MWPGHPRKPIRTPTGTLPGQEGHHDGSGRRPESPPERETTPDDPNCKRGSSPDVPPTPGHGAHSLRPGIRPAATLHHDTDRSEAPHDACHVDGHSSRRRAVGRPAPPPIAPRRLRPLPTCRRSAASRLHTDFSDHFIRIPPRQDAQGPIISAAMKPPRAPESRRPPVLDFD